MNNGPFVIITAARDEASHIEELIRSVCAQSVRPSRWIIVSDGSIDGTDAIVEKFAATEPYITLIRRDSSTYGFASKVHAIREAYEQLSSQEFDFIGILDADVTLSPGHFATLLERFGADPQLGLSGGFIYEESAGSFSARGSNRAWQIAGAAQFFRRTCYEAIGGLRPLQYGAEDWLAETSARYHGWKAYPLPDLPVYHHRQTGTARNLVKYCFRAGKQDYSLGSHWSFELAKCFSRALSAPILAGSILRLAGYLTSSIVREERCVPEELMLYLQRQQKSRLSNAVRTRIRRIEEL